MSKERARRREAREKEAAIIAAARAAQAEKRERRDARSRAVRSRLPSARRRRAGILAQRRRRQTGATIALVLGLNPLVWVIFPDWPTRVMVLLVSLLAVPVLHTVMFRR